VRSGPSALIASASGISRTTCCASAAVLRHVASQRIDELYAILDELSPA
jgi:hypothetical protein